MNKTGLCSITFRDLSCEEIIEIVSQAKLDAIEWGSDVHVLPNDFERAKEISHLMDDAGLITSSYGTYYRVGIENEYAFEDILKTAEILKARDIRVWAGRKGSEDADLQYRKEVIKDAQRIADLASEKGIRISFEYHARTLTDTVSSALDLLERVNRDNVKIYWQPAVDVAVPQRIKNIEALGEYITNIHVFSWKGIERLELIDHKREWLRYIDTINQFETIQPRFYLMEFVKDDSKDQFFKDAKNLRRILGDETLA